MKKKIAIVLCAILCMIVCVLPAFAVGGNIPVNRDGLTESELEQYSDYKSLPQYTFVSDYSLATITFTSASYRTPYLNSSTVQGMYTTIVRAYYMGYFCGYKPFAFGIISLSSSKKFVVLCAPPGIGTQPVLDGSGGTNYVFRYLEGTAQYQFSPFAFELRNGAFVPNSTISSSLNFSSVVELHQIQYSDWSTMSSPSLVSLSDTYGTNSITQQGVLDFVNVVNTRYILLSTVIAPSTSMGDFTSYPNAIYHNGYTDGYTDGSDMGSGEAYQNGYTDGYETGYSEGYTDGYETGYSDGFAEGSVTPPEELESIYDDGYYDGYESGYVGGQRDGSALLDIGGIISAIPTAAKGIINNVFGFELFGINVAGLLSALLVVGIIAFVVKWLMSR